MHNAFHNKRQSNIGYEATWHIRKYIDFNPIDYPYIYLFFLIVAHELQHAQQCDSLRMRHS